jgi:hypothetical protein
MNGIWICNNKEAIASLSTADLSRKKYLAFLGMACRWDFVFDILHPFHFSIEAIEQELVTLARFYHEFLKMLAVFRASFDESVNTFGNHLEERFQAMADGHLAQLSPIVIAEGVARLSGLNSERLAENDSPVEAFLDSKEHSLAKENHVKNLHQVSLILCHSEVHGNLMKA